MPIGRFLQGAALGAAAGARVPGLPWGWAIGAALGGLSALLQPDREEIGTSAPATRSTLRTSSTDAPWIVGRARTGGVLVFAHSSGPDLHLAITIGEGVHEGIERVWFDGVQVPFVKTARDGGGMRLTPESATGYRGSWAMAEYFAADGAGGDSLRTAAPGLWTDAHRLQGVSWVHVWLRQPGPVNDFHRDLAERGQPFVSSSRRWESVPEIEFQVQGIKISWPGQNTPVWTESAAAVRYWWLRSRREIPVDDIEDASVKTAHTVANHRLVLPVALGSGGYSPEDRRYTVNGVIRAGDAPDAVEREMDFAWQGQVVESRGRFVFKPGEAPGTPTVTIDDSALSAFITSRVSPPLDDRVNALSCTLAQSREHDYQKLDIPAYSPPGSSARDGAVFSADLGIRSLVTSPIAASRLMAVQLRRAQARVWVFDLRPNITILPVLRAGATAMLSSETYAITETVVAVDAVEVLTDSSIRVTLREEAAATYRDTFVQPPRKGGDLAGAETITVGPDGFPGILTDVAEWPRGPDGKPMLIPDHALSATPNEAWRGELSGGGVEWPFKHPASGSQYQTEAIDAGGNYEAVAVQLVWFTPTDVPATQRQLPSEITVETGVLV